MRNWKKKKKERTVYLLVSIAAEVIGAGAGKVVGFRKHQNRLRKFVDVKAVRGFPLAVYAFVPLLEGNFLDADFFPSLDNLVLKDSRFAAATPETLFWFCHVYHLGLITLGPLRDSM